MLHHWYFCYDLRDMFYLVCSITYFFVWLCPVLFYARINTKKLFIALGEIAGRCESNLVCHFLDGGIGFAQNLLSFSESHVSDKLNWGYACECFGLAEELCTAYSE